MIQPRLLPARLRVARTDADDALIASPSTRMLLAFAALGKPMYEGTVPAHIKARRRAKNKAARHARRAAR